MKRTLPLILAALGLILDSRCAAESVRSALALCGQTLIPGLFPLLVLSAMLVPALQGVRIPALRRLISLPKGAEGIFLLGMAGGFPVGAACTAQAVRAGALTKKDGARMLGLTSFSGPAFLFGVLPAVLPMVQVAAVFFIQLGSALMIGAFWPGQVKGTAQTSPESVCLTEAVRRAVSSMTTVCAWVVLAAVAAGFLNRWLFHLLPGWLGLTLTGLLELTGGIFATVDQDGPMRFLLCSGFVCFGGFSVLLQITALAQPEGIPMGPCVAQKALQGILGAALAAACLRFGPWTFAAVPMLLFLKKAVAFPGMMVYNSRRKEGITDAVS